MNQQGIKKRCHTIQSPNLINSRISTIEDDTE